MYGVNGKCFEEKSQALNELCSNSFPVFQNGSLTSCQSVSTDSISLQKSTEGTSTTYSLTPSFHSCEVEAFNPSQGSGFFALGLSIVILFWVLSKKIGLILSLVK